MSINSTFRRSVDMSTIIDVTSVLPLSSLAHWERLIRGEFSLALRSSAMSWTIAWAKPNRFLTWVDLCSWDGYVRERTLRTLSGPAPNSFFFSLAARRINDWVPEVRAAAREKLPLIAKQSSPEHVVDALCAMLPSWASWGRMEEVDQQVVAELLAIQGVSEALKLRLMTMAVGPMSVVLCQAAYSGPNRPHDPIQTHQSFRFKPATYSGWIKSTHSVSNRASDSGLNPPLWAGC